MKIRMCRCRQCLYGLRHSKKEGKHVTQQCRHGRRRAKQLIKSGEFDRVETAISIDYVG